MRRQALAATTATGPQHPADAMHLAWPGPPPRGQHTRTVGAGHPPGDQPRLDSNRISLYRHHDASVHQHGPPATVHHDMRRGGRCHVRRQDYPDPGTPTEPTTTTDSTPTIKTSSANHLTPTAPIVGVRSDGQHAAAVTIDLLHAGKLTGRGRQAMLFTPNHLWLCAVSGGVLWTLCGGVLGPGS